MPELKRSFTKGKMNKDLDERMVPNGEYRDALNIEVATSEGSNVGTVQTIKGNTDIKLPLSYNLGSNATCIGSIANEKNNKLYWLVSAPDKNTAASQVQTGFVTQGGELGDGSAITITHDVFSDYVMEYDEVANNINYIAVEHYKVQTTISNDAHGTDANHLHISDLGNSNDIRVVGIQPGMDVIVTTTHNNISTTVRTSIIKIEKDDSGTWNGWRVFTKHTTADGSLFEALDSVKAGDTVTFELPYEKRALGFTHFAATKPQKLVTGINIIDDLLFWTDGLTEPKKINIERCRYGSQHLSPSTYPNGTNIYYTLLVVNGTIPHPSNGRLSSDVTTYPAGYSYMPLTYRETTVIRKSPTSPLLLTMSNTTRADIALDGSLIVNSVVNIASASSPNSSDFFFESSGKRLSYGSLTDPLQFPYQMDWVVGDFIEFFPDDEDAGTLNDVLVTAKIVSVLNGDTFEFEIRTISTKVVKPITSYRAKLKQSEPLFEFKFPRFAYRWRYEDGEYSTYSPFSEVAFLPNEFDYLPKKGYNLGMTNNLRYLLLSGFKPITTPLDVVEIDILYKESNSPNVYTVETIKSPSVKVDSLKTNSHPGDEAWFGRIKHEGNWSEGPNTLTATTYTVGTNNFDGNFVLQNGIYYYGVDRDFGVANMKIGDVVNFENITSGLASPIVISGFINTTSQGTIANTSISLTANGVAVADASPTWNSGPVIDPTNDEVITEGESIYFDRSIATKPALYIDYPKGSFEVKTDMIHATLPSNQLLRPWDNVPINALSQEITGNRVVYGNYTQNYDLTDVNNEVITNSFQTVVTKRKNIRENVRYNDATALRDPANGSVINWWDIRNAIIESPSLPERSIKSLRDYQIGVVYADEFGRQTPIQTHETGTIKITKDKASKYNQLNLHLRDAKDPNQKKNATFPSWASHYKYFVKENSNEYHNLAMDRFYDAEDGNIWLSFPSSERNKVDEETFLILKKQHDTNHHVPVIAKYKILAISNEAPLFVKTKTNSFGTLSIAASAFASGGQPRYKSQHLDIPDSHFDETGSFFETIGSKNRVVRVSNENNISNYYDVVSITSYGNHKRLLLRKPFDTDLSFTTDDGTNAGIFTTSALSIEIAEREIKNLAEFEGRFFVKVEKDAALEKNILSKAPDKVYTVSNAVGIGNLFESSNNRNVLRKKFWEDDAPDKEFFVDSLVSEGIINTGGEPGGYSSNSYCYNGQGLHGANNIIDISFAKFQGQNDFDPPWHLATTSDDVVTKQMKEIGAKLKTAGQLFRWKGDTTTYRIKHVTTHAVENFWGKQNAGYYTNASNHREKYKISFEPALGASGVEDAIGNVSTGYNPFTHSKESGSLISDAWSNAEPNFDKRTMEFLEEFVSDNSYTSDNPAIWETEPKENVDIDIYNEASETIPIGYEWNSFLNRFKFYPYSRSWNPINYYNCFSFANGVESNRIRDDYNAPTIDKGPKVSTVLAEQYRQEQRKSGLIYSGIYNSTSGVNNLNQFIQAEKITKDINPTYGSIQKLFSRDTDLVTFCEDRVIKVLANKDAVFNADGNINLTSTNNVLGQATPYGGDYGISTNPESFAVDQYRAYFTDKSRGSVMRLSMDGITPISDLGMRDWFKDSFKLNSLVLLGSYDDNKKVYNLTVETTNAELKKSSLSSNSPAGATKTYFGITGNSGQGLVPSSVQAQDWAPFDVNNSINFIPSAISFIDVSLYDYNNVFQSTWFKNLKTGVDSGISYNFAIGVDNLAQQGPYGENVYTVVSVSDTLLSASGAEYRRIYLTWDFGTIDLHAHNVYMIYYLKDSAPKKVSPINPYTVTFSEDTKGWTTFKSWRQENGLSLNDKYFTFKNSNLYEHHSNETRNNFYGAQYVSTVCTLFNDMPSSIKNFSSLSYEGTQSKIDQDLTDQEYYNNAAVDGWYAESITTDLETGFIPEFKEKEGKWFNYIRGNQENTLDNLNVKQFSTQGIGIPSGVQIYSSAGQTTSKLTQLDVGDTD